MLNLFYGEKWWFKNFRDPKITVNAIFSCPMNLSLFRSCYVVCSNIEKILPSVENWFYYRLSMVMGMTKSVVNINSVVFRLLYNCNNCPVGGNRRQLFIICLRQHLKKNFSFHLGSILAQDHQVTSTEGDFNSLTTKSLYCQMFCQVVRVPAKSSAEYSTITSTRQYYAAFNFWLQTWKYSHRLF